MADEPNEGKGDPTPEDLAKHRIPDKLSQPERETFEGKIRELEQVIEELKAKLADALKPKAEPKKKSVLERFAP